jgi:hypothetical protein
MIRTRVDVDTAHDVSCRRGATAQSLRRNHPTVFTPAVRLHRYLIGSSVALPGLFLYSFTIGSYPIPVETVIVVFLHHLHLVDKTWGDAVDME